MDIRTLTEPDRNHIWHPYSPTANSAPAYPAERVDGVTITPKDGRRLLDGMSSWWVVVHGYNHPRLNHAAVLQPEKISYVMFGGFTRDATTKLTQTLLGILLSGLDTVSYADSGLVAMEVAMKMAVQYQYALSVPRRSKLVVSRVGYHGDIWYATSMCSPATGMHSLFAGRLSMQFFLPQPPVRFGESWREKAVALLVDLLDKHDGEIVALTVEPVVQGAGGIYFYAPEHLKRVQALCREHGTLLVFDEITAGFGCMGKLFVCEHAGAVPSITCLGKVLTGGYLMLFAAATHKNIADTVSNGAAGCFIHGPTFMANPLACAVADKSIRLLVEGGWCKNVARIGTQLRETLAPVCDIAVAKEVRVLGVINVVEMWEPVNLRRPQSKLAERGAWLRPFGKLVYTMPPFIIQPHELNRLLDDLIAALKEEYGG